MNPTVSVPALSTAALAAAIAAAAPGSAVEAEACSDIDSTNDTLLARCRARQPVHPLLLAADRQRAGRGRQQRRWDAPPLALLFSLAVPLVPLPPRLPAVTLAIGAALADALATRGVVVELKWPNDLLLDRRKLGGILCELALDGAGATSLVIGIGINGAFSHGAGERVEGAAALGDVLPADDLAKAREAWIAALAAAALAAVQSFARDGFAPWRVRCNARLAGRGRAGDLLDAGRRVASGRIVEVDDDGRLVLATPAGEQRIASGELSLRMGAPA